MTNATTADRATTTQQTNTRIADAAHSVLLDELDLPAMAVADVDAGLITAHVRGPLDDDMRSRVGEDVYAEVAIQTGHHLSVTIENDAETCDGCGAIVPADTLTRQQSDQIDYTTPVFENFCQTCRASDEHA